MKNFKFIDQKNNRNLLRYTLTDTFMEPPFYTFTKLFESLRFYIVNKKENIENYDQKCIFILTKGAKTYHALITISQDQLITLHISGNNLSLNLTERDMYIISEKISEVFG